MEKARAILRDELSLLDKVLLDLFNVNHCVLCDIKNFVCGKSKRIRSILCLLYLKSHNIKIDDSIINLMAATELLHNASLLHDDVIDESDYRREQKTIANIYNPKISILSGDYIITYAINILLDMDSNIAEKFLKAAKDMSIAEINQYLLRGKMPSFDEYLSIIEGKTASLFAVLLQTSALIAGLDENKASEFGKLFGLVFQINNDMSCDSVENDKKNSVNTVVDILGIEKANDLKDNYKKVLIEEVYQLNESKYREALEDLINLL